MWIAANMYREMVRRRDTRQSNEQKKKWNLLEGVVYLTRIYLLNGTWVTHTTVQMSPHFEHIVYEWNAHIQHRTQCTYGYMCIYTRHSLAHSHARNQFLCGITTTVADTVCACVLKVQTIWHGKATDVAAEYYLFIYLFVVCVLCSICIRFCCILCRVEWIESESDNKNKFINSRFFLSCHRHWIIKRFDVLFIALCSLFVCHFLTNVYRYRNWWWSIDRLMTFKSSSYDSEQFWFDAGDFWKT